jgi:ribonuclease HI
MVFIKTFGALQIPLEKQVTLSTRKNKLLPTLVYPLASFDGTTKDDGMCSGAGRILRVSARRLYKLFFNCGIVSNTKEEFLGAWATLYIENCLTLKKLQILGDSKVIIDWINFKGELYVFTLEGWKHSFRMLIKSFKFYISSTSIRN